MEILNYIFMIPLFAAVSCRIFSIENPDGSYTTGLNSDSTGQSENSVAALLAKAAGYTFDENFQRSSSDINFPEDLTQQFLENEESPAESRNLLEPHLEILKLIETFLRFKGEIGSRIYALLSDNYDLLRTLYLTMVNKIGTLHSFTLTGIRILRTILEFAVSLFGQWQIQLPQVSFDLNVAKPSSQGASFHVSKNTNFFSNQ